MGRFGRRSATDAIRNLDLNEDRHVDLLVYSSEMRIVQSPAASYGLTRYRDRVASSVWAVRLDLRDERARRNKPTLDNGTQHA